MDRHNDQQGISRRAFLQLGGLSLAAVAAAPLAPYLVPYPPGERFQPVKMRGRVATDALYIYSEPNTKSPRRGLLKRDVLLDLLEEVTSPYGPRYNPRWYRVEDGYIHSAYIQRVEGARNVTPVASVPESGQLCEICVPWVQSLRWRNHQPGDPVYRLYYESVHWVTGVEPGPDGQLWSLLTDERLRIPLGVPASCIRLIPPEALTPLSTEVPPEEKRIEVSLEEQMLRAFEGDQVVMQTEISSGADSFWTLDNGIPSSTPVGNFHISSKFPSKHMGDGKITADLEAYELPGVPWVSFFHITGVGFHGTYWHDNFGHKMSHGCVNMRTAEALWIYRWSVPSVPAGAWYERAMTGTRVKVY